MNNSASVTVIVVNFNQARFIKDAFLSIRNQTLSPEKVIVVDDGSAPTDVEDLRRLISETGIEAQCFIQDAKNLGISARLNQALKEVSTEWLLVLAADDVLLPNSIENLFDSVTDSVDVVWGDLDVMDEQGDSLGFSRPRDTWQGTVSTRYKTPNKPFKDLLKFNNFIPGGMTLIRTKTVVDAGGWDSSITTEDFDLWLRISKTSQFKYITKSVGKYRVVEGSKSRRDSHKLRDQALFLSKHAGASKETDKGIAYLAAMRWAFTVLRMRRIPDYSLSEMATGIGVSPLSAWLQMPRAISTPIYWSAIARVKRLTK
ncbi:MAG: glycosyltransferase [Actinobacteria bacterium]|nr:glycosyltransferase [Actinomycetota bacterium]